MEAALLPQLLSEVASAAAYLHANGVLHCDIACRNIMLHGKNAWVGQCAAALVRVHEWNVHRMALCVPVIVSGPSPLCVFVGLVSVHI